MGLSMEDLDRVERYVLGQLDPAEAQAVETAVQHDAAWAEAVEAERQAQALARAARLLELREVLQAHARPTRRFVPWAVVGLAAAVIAFVVYFGFLRQATYVGTAQDIWSDWQGNAGALRADSTEEDAAAVTYWSAGLPDSLDRDGRLAQALRHMNHGRWPAAIAGLQALSTERTERGREALFFLGLAHAQAGEAAAAKQSLEAYLQDPGVRHRDRATKLLSDL